MVAHMRKFGRATNDMRLFDRHAADMANSETLIQEVISGLNLQP